MRHAVTIVMVLAVVWAVPAGVLACGDKFLAVSRGTRFQRAGLVRRPATVLLLTPPGGRLAASVQSLGVVQALEKVGYTVVSVPDPAQLAAVMQQRRWDLMVGDMEEVPSTSTLEAPKVVVVAWDTPRTAVGRARKSYGGVVVRPQRARTVVEAVDDALFAMALRPNAPRTGD